MPRLVLLAACDKCLIDFDGSVSAIGIFSVLRVASEATLNPRSVGPKDWAILAMWKGTGIEDVGQTFTQQLKVLDQKGAEFGASRDDFKLGEGTHTLRTNVNAMPIGIEGNIIVRVWLEANGKRVTDECDYTITIMHSLPPQT